MIDFLEAVKGRPVIMDFSTIPAWMFKTREPVRYETEPDKLVRGYGTQGTELRDPSGKELGDYYARLLQWYTQGGFTDEYGKRRASNLMALTHLHTMPLLAYSIAWSLILRPCGARLKAK